MKAPQARPARECPDVAWTEAGEFQVGVNEQNPPPATASTLSVLAVRSTAGYTQALTVSGQLRRRLGESVSIDVRCPATEGADFRACAAFGPLYGRC